MKEPSSPDAAEAPAALSPFDPEQLRLRQGEGANLGVQKVLVRVPVRKPKKQEFFRVHPGEEYRLDTALLELKDENEIYLVMPNMRDALLGEVQPYRLQLAANRQGVVFFIPVRIPGEDGRSNPWHESLASGCELATSQWVRITADMSLGGYQPYMSRVDHPEPDWPEKTLEELLEIAFKGYVIDGADHPVIRRLYGQI